MSAIADRAQRAASSLVARPLFWAVVICLGLAIPIVRTLLIPVPPPLPVLGTLPPFELTDQDGKPFGSNELRGQVWVANFIFTRCPTICPKFSAQMAQVQHRARNLGTALHLVSFSVDPTYDTPERLRAYGQRFQASPRMWTFVTGDPQAIKQTVVDGLKISLGREGPDDDFLSIFHGTHFVLVDAEGKIRGYYDSTQPGAVDAVLRDAGLLVNRGS